MSNLEKWAEKEIELALKSVSNDEHEYMQGCYESAFKAFKVLCKDNHSMCSVQITKNILPSLFKHVRDDGSVTYKDNDYISLSYVDNPNVTFHNGFLSGLIHEMYPITMPYYPNNPIKGFVEEFLFDPANGERIDINRFFKEAPKNSKKPYIEITEEEFNERKTFSKFLATSINVPND